MKVQWLRNIEKAPAKNKIYEKKSQANISINLTTFAKAHIATKQENTLQVAQMTTENISRGKKAMDIPDPLDTC